MLYIDCMVIDSSSLDISCQFRNLLGIYSIQSIYLIVASIALWALIDNCGNARTFYLRFNDDFHFNNLHF